MTDLKSSRQSHKQSDAKQEPIGHSRFPALQADCLVLLRVIISSWRYLPCYDWPLWFLWFWFYNIQSKSALKRILSIITHCKIQLSKKIRFFKMVWSQKCTKFSKSYSSLNSHLGTIQLHNQRPTTTSACVKNCHVAVDRKSNWPKLKRISFVTVRSVRRINYPWEMKTGTVMKMWNWYYELGSFIRYIKSWILGRLGYHFKTAPLSYLAVVYHYNR